MAQIDVNNLSLGYVQAQSTGGVRCATGAVPGGGGLEVSYVPLNFVDILSRVQLENLILCYRPTCCLWSTTGTLYKILPLK